MRDAGLVGSGFVFGWLMSKTWSDSGCATRGEERAMTRRFKVGDHVGWNSEAGRVSGRIIKVHTRDVSYKGYTHHASKDDPHYAIKSDKSDHVAMHKASALRRLRG